MSWRIWITANQPITEGVRSGKIISLCSSIDCKRILKTLSESLKKSWHSISRRLRGQKSIMIKIGLCWGRPLRMKQLKFLPWPARTRRLTNLLWFPNWWTWESLFRNRFSIQTYTESWWSGMTSTFSVTNGATRKLLSVSIKLMSFKRL